MTHLLLKKYIPSPIWLFAKMHAAGFRYRYKSMLCRRSFRFYRHIYPQKILFIAGLPKSGTTWLENMISSYPGIHNILIPEATIDELQNCGSHHYDLPTNFTSRFANMIALTKMHIPGSLHNTTILHKANLRYVILYRDLRDVAVSYYFYVRQTPWHPEYRQYRRFDLHTGLDYFAKHTLKDFAEWTRLWKQNRDPEKSLMLNYEKLIANTENCLSDVANLFELDNHPETIRKIVHANNFAKLSGGREPGQSDDRSFYRNGISGNWKSVFTEKIKTIYKQKVGDFLIEFGFEDNYAW